MIQDVILGVHRHAMVLAHEPVDSAAASATSDPLRSAAPARRRLRHGLLLESADPTPSAIRSARKIALTWCLRFIFHASHFGCKLLYTGFAFRHVPATLTVLTAALFWRWPYSADAHDIPNDVNRYKPLLSQPAKQMHLLVRVPLKAMRATIFPARANGYMTARVDPLPPRRGHAVDFRRIELYEGDTRWQNPKSSRRACRSIRQIFRILTGGIGALSRAKLANDTDIFWNQVMLDVLFEYQIHSDASRFFHQIQAASDAWAARITVMRFLPPSGVVRAFRIFQRPGAGPARSPLAPAALRFVGWDSSIF